MEIIIEVRHFNFVSYVFDKHYTDQMILFVLNGQVVTHSCKYKMHGC